MNTNQTILSVSQLNKHVKNYLENELGTVKVEGEISNMSRPSSGHLYFTLKDSTAQIRCVFFKNRHHRFSGETMADGTHIVVSGTLSLYEARGDYQLIVEQVTEAGLGLLYQKFEALKIQLAAEGLFDASRKKPLPAMPQTIGVITSTTGAAIQDILSTLAKRFPLAKVVIYPSEVQGATASKQLIKALQRANERPVCDVLILARGGGSIEDLWAFNDALLARQIAQSTIPVVSGVGHETDFTIADFVADYRAETPTAAACAVTPVAKDLIHYVHHLVLQLQRMLSSQLQAYQLTLTHLKSKIASPRHAIMTYWQTVDYLEKRLYTELSLLLQKRAYQLQVLNSKLQAKSPEAQLQQAHIRLTLCFNQLTQHMQKVINNRRFQMSALMSTLHAVSPLATLDRGYAIATVGHKVLFSAQQVVLGDAIRLRLAAGLLDCKVTHIVSLESGTIDNSDPMRRLRTRWPDGATK